MNVETLKPEISAYYCHLLEHSSKTPLSTPDSCWSSHLPTFTASETSWVKKATRSFLKSDTPTHALTTTPDYIPPLVFFAARQTSFPMMLYHRQSWFWETESPSQSLWVFYEEQLFYQDFLVWLQSLYLQSLMNKDKWCHYILSLITLMEM